MMRNDMVKKYRVFEIGLLAFFADFVSKYVVSSKMIINDSKCIINNFLYIRHVHNTGIAFSFLEGNRGLIIILCIFVMYYIIDYIIKNNITSWMYFFGYGMLFGGALGNFFDRIVYGYVIDFIDVRIFGYYYPVFNFADIFVICGIILIIFDGFGRSRYNGNSCIS